MRYQLLPKFFDWSFLSFSGGWWWEESKVDLTFSLGTNGKGVKCQEKALFIWQLHPRRDRVQASVAEGVRFQDVVDGHVVG